MKKKEKRKGKKRFTYNRTQNTNVSKEKIWLVGNRHNLLCR